MKSIKSWTFEFNKSNVLALKLNKMENKVSGSQDFSMFTKRKSWQNTSIQKNDF